MSANADVPLYRRRVILLSPRHCDLRGGLMRPRQLVKETVPARTSREEETLNKKATKAEVAAMRKAELEAISDVQERIDRVAHDLSTGKNRYAVLDAVTLGELLDVNCLDAADGSWFRAEFVFRAQPEDNVDCVFPLAENVDLLKDKIGTTRYARLAKRAETITATGTGGDLTLTEKEERLLRHDYQLQHGGDDGLTLASKCLLATSLVELCFHSSLSDGYPDGTLWSPYDIKRGEGFNSSEFFSPESPIDWPRPAPSRKGKRSAAQRKVVSKRMERAKKQKGSGTRRRL